jgi:hypothetical protein
LVYQRPVMGLVHSLEIAHKCLVCQLISVIEWLFSLYKGAILLPPFRVVSTYQKAAK